MRLRRGAKFQLSSRSSYDGWMLLRPAIESVLIIGKWVEDKENAAIWSDRVARKTEYIKAFPARDLFLGRFAATAELKGVLDSVVGPCQSER